ncbi:uncharacterized protein LOC110807992 isoform X2 [Carica papaya]|uniref:uncharacterized protein LOC110807992 isoform X2 n=1 Tax=Carica papaya TaxID=3649 RepID=UPI000B8C98E6|nr:uncharacterized protein LOC110807992 isoform X2 [Carica papaya]
MTYLLSFHIPHSPAFPKLSSSSSSSFKPKKLWSSSHSKSEINSNKLTLAARDTIIDFGMHKGKLLGTLPSTYLRWVSKNLRAQDSEHWAKLADEVLRDPIYQDRIEWEFAERVLHGNSAAISMARNENAVSMLLDISNRFGWDNEDKAGWAEVNFELLGTSKGGRIPRLLDGKTNNIALKDKLMEQEREKAESVLSENSKRRRERRQRTRIKRKGELEEKMATRDESNKDASDDNSLTMEVENPFPGRQALLKKCQTFSKSKGSDNLAANLSQFSLIQEWWQLLIGPVSRSS